MKNLFKVFAAIVVISLFSTIVKAQVTLTGNHAGAELVKVLTIVNTTPLHFGVIGITSGTAGSVLMSTAGLRTTGAATTTIINSGTQKTVALFNLTGTATDTYSISLPATIAVSTGEGGGNFTTTISALMVKVDDATETIAAGATGTLSSLGASSFLLSGTLNKAAAQAIGVQYPLQYRKQVKNIYLSQTY